jgi:diguanylate cyclase (GGDEF)-like protein
MPQELRVLREPERDRCGVEVGTAIALGAVEYREVGLMRHSTQRQRSKRAADPHSQQQLRCGTFVPPLRLDAADLDALLGVVRARSTAELDQAGARLRSLLGAAGTDFEPHIAAVKTKLLEMERLRYLAATDPLTGLANRRAVMEALRRDLARASRSGAALSLVMLDIDDFKAINDTYGHAEGDEVLRLCARCVKAVTRNGDLVGRLGGDEIVVVLPETDSARAVAIGERIRSDLAASSQHRAQPIGLSFGVATSSSSSSAHALMAAADRAMYQDKAARRVGRDREINGLAAHL